MKPPRALANAAWEVAVEGEDVEMRLTFCVGRTFEASMPVGGFEHVGATFVATVGDNIRLMVDLDSQFVDRFDARITTKQDGQLIDERATLFRADWN